MARLETDAIPMGTPCPEFDLPAVDGRRYRLQSFKDAKALVVMFICNHCPYVKAIEDRYVALAKSYQGQPVQFVGVCANDPTDYPDDGFDNLKERWLRKGYGFPYLHDLSQDVARAFGAVCTPDIYVYDADRKLAYHGRFDDNWQEPAQVTRQDLKEAIDALLAGKTPPAEQVPSMGCSIKWRKG
jgi:thiol-disulfide isomerase/thioredoxin